jgi:hypothetical protein
MKPLHVLPFKDAPSAACRKQRILVAVSIALLTATFGTVVYAQDSENQSPTPDRLVAAAENSVQQESHGAQPDDGQTSKPPAIHWRTHDRFVTPTQNTEPVEPQGAQPDEQELKPPAAAHRPIRDRPVVPAEDTELAAPQVTQPGNGPALKSVPARIPDSSLRQRAIVEPEDVEPEAEPDGVCDVCPRSRQCPADRLEVRAEWLLWWGKGDSVPALVTTGPTSQTQAQAGVLGAPGTSILFGDSELNGSSSSGVRAALDYWLARDHSLGLEVEYFTLFDNSQGFNADSNTYPVLARPFFNTQTLANDSGLIGYPGVQTGNVSISSTTDLQGVAALLRQTWFRGCDAHLDFLAGYRYLRLTDDLNVNEFETFINPQGTVPVNSTLSLSDHFGTANQFQGADLGFITDWHCHRWSLEFLLKVGLGDTTSRVSIGGTTVATEPTQAPVVSPGGFLAQASNSGTFQHSQFTMVPELGLNLGFDLTPRLRLTGGYSLIYWSAVARAGDQIDLDLATSQFPPPQTAGHFPEFRFAMTDYWAQGVNLGLDYRF